MSDAAPLRPLVTNRKFVTLAVIALLIIFFLEMAFSVSRETQTWDEGAHIYAGYSYWTRKDFGINPEHPPLVKLVAAVPLLAMRLNPVAPRAEYFKEEEFLDGSDFLYGNDADVILLRTRLAAGLFALILAILVFAAATEMFGIDVGLMALVLFVFEPNFIAHGALVTTDVGVSCLIFATVYAFYRYVRQPSRGRLVLVGVAAGCSLATKHSGVLVFAMLALLAAIEIATGPRERAMKASLRTLAALGLVAAIAVGLLWAVYGFRYSARPDGVMNNPSLVETMDVQKHPSESSVLLRLARWRVLPEAYLYGLADVKAVADSSPSYLFGKVYPHGVWYYFPAAFLIKSTVTLLVFLLLACAALATGKLKRHREALFLAVPAGLYFAVAMASGLNIGVRHILPCYPFLIILGAAGAWAFARRSKVAFISVAMLLLFHMISSIACYPNYLAYANEVWGGPANSHRYLTDSNADWGQQLKTASAYLRQNHIQQCWFAYFVGVVAKPEYYGIPCQPLTTISSVWLKPQIDVPQKIAGTVLISAGVLSGYEFGPGKLNPYAQFASVQPKATIDRGLFVYEGEFKIPLASALNHATLARRAAESGSLDESLFEADAAVHLAPDSARVRAVRAHVLKSLHRDVEARRELELALQLARSIEPEYQKPLATDLEQELAQP